MDEEERLSVRLSSDDILLLKELVYLGRFPSEADAVKVAIHSFLDSCFSADEKQALLEKARSRRTLDLSAFTSNGSDANATLSKVIGKGLNSGEEGE